jgi:ATP-dependent Lhr-like helicase
VFEFFHALLNPRIRIDQSFASVTHHCSVRPKLMSQHYKMRNVGARANLQPLDPFHPAVRDWFTASFAAPTRPQALGWPAISRGESTLILAPTGRGKTLTAFLWCLDRLMFVPRPDARQRCRVLYVSPLKALAVDVERNLRAPLAGIARIAENRGDVFVPPAIAIRTGDTPAVERARFQRDPADILITTPESLYLLLTSNARDVLRGIQTVIIDEIHALVPTKRGAHPALSSKGWRPAVISRHSASGSRDAAAARRSGSLPGRSGPRASSRQRSRSTTKRPAPAADTERAIEDEFATHSSIRFRPITIVDAGAKKAFDLRIEVPVEDMARLTTADDIPSGPASVGDPRPSIWSAIHPRLLELIRAHRSTLIFVNSRRLAERLAGALNELAGETLVRSHHGSIAREQRMEIEDRLKAGTLRALVATSSLELGIDMGAIDPGSRSKRRHLWRAGCSASAAAAITSTRSVPA